MPDSVELGVCPDLEDHHQRTTPHAVFSTARAGPAMEFFNDVGDDPLKPTLFELVAQEQLRDLLQPALKYVLSVRVPSS